MELTAIIITKDEEKNVKDCIQSLDFSNEIIVIDNGSKDATVSIAEKLGAKVFQLPGLDFSYLRNVGREKAAHDWLLYIDADEIVTEKLVSEIRQVLTKGDKYWAYSIVRKNFYLGYPWPKDERIIRLIKKEALIGWQGSLHETPIVTGLVGKLFSPLMHYAHKDLSSMIDKTNNWSEIEAQLRYNSNHPRMVWWRFFRIMLSSFWQSYIRDRGWRAGTAGLVESIYQSFSSFITYAKLWEKQHKPEIIKGTLSEKCQKS